MSRAPRTLALADLPAPESSIQAAIKQVLELDGWRVFETDRQRRHEDGTVRHPLSEPGAPDLLCLRYEPWNGACESPAGLALQEVMWIEVKSRKGKARQHQKLWHAAERARGALVVVLGEDCAADWESWRIWYERSGLCRRKLR